MQPLKLKETLLVIAFAIATAAATYAYGVQPAPSLGVLYKADLYFFLAIRLGLTMLFLVIPFRRFMYRLFATFIGFFIVGYFVPLVHLPDAGDIIYLMYFAITLGIMFVLYLVAHSKYALRSAVAYTLIVLLLAASAGLIAVSIPWSKAVAEEYTKFYTYDYLRCHGNEVDPETFHKMCSSLTGPFWQPDAQKLCYSWANNGAKGGDSCYSLDYYTQPRNRYTNFLVDHWKIRQSFGFNNASF